MKTDRGLSLALALLSALLFAAATPLSKLLLAEFEPIRLAGLLYLGASLGVLPVVLRERRARVSPAMNRANRLRLAGAILCGGVLGPVVYLIGLRIASSMSVSLWLNLELVATALLGHFIFRDQLGRYGWLGVAGIVAAGVLLSIGEGSLLFAAGLIALACFFWGIDNHLTALIDGISPAQSTLWKGLAAGSFNIGVSVFAGTSWPSSKHVLTAIALGAFSYGVSISLYIASAQKLGATRAQIIFASSPFLAALLSTLLLSEPFGLLHAVAIVLLAAAVFMILRDQQVHDHVHLHTAIDHEHSHHHDDGHHLHDHSGVPASNRHSHWHHHEPLAHRHPHWPDLHHRHPHD